MLAIADVGASVIPALRAMRVDPIIAVLANVSEMFVRSATSSAMQLLVLQRGHRIDSRCAACRCVRSDRRYQENRTRRAQQDERIGR